MWKNNVCEENEKKNCMECRNLDNRGTIVTVSEGDKKVWCVYTILGNTKMLQVEGVKDGLCLAKGYSIPIIVVQEKLSHHQQRSWIQRDT
jgi:hypothetical protein